MMKTKKILAVLISCLLLIGVVAGITASAADTPAVAIAQANISYEGATRILYTLNTADLEAGQTVKVGFSFDADATEYVLVSDAFDLDGTMAVYSPGFAPADMTKKVYATPMVVDADSNVVAKGAVVGFSVYEYMMARFGGEYTPEQFLLYTATLDFGGSVQAAAKATEGKDPENGYADEYYVLSVMNGDGSVTEYKFAEATEYQLVAPRSSNGKLFDSFVDNKGVKYEDADFNKLVVSLDKPGYIYVKAVYGNEDAVSATIPAGYSDTLPNLDATPATVKGGSDYYVESGVTLSAGASATLAFNPDVATVTLAENAGKITVNDGVSSFEMANGAALRIEYTVISTTKKTGVLFYYVDGEYVAKSDVTSVENATFTGVTAAAVAGDFAVDGVILGYKAGNATFSPGNDATVTADYGANGKYFVYNKATYNAGTAGTIVFYTEGDVAANKTVFETKMKLSAGYISGDWRKCIDIDLCQYGGGKLHYQGKLRIRFATTDSLAIMKSQGGTTVAETITIPGGIRADEWFDLKIETTSGTNASVNVYINGHLIYTKTEFVNDNGEYTGVAVSRIQFRPLDTSNGTISFEDPEIRIVK